MNDGGSSGDGEGSSSSSDDVSCTTNTCNAIATTQPQRDRLHSAQLQPGPSLQTCTCRHNAEVHWPLLTTLPHLPPGFLQVNEPSKAAPICRTTFTTYFRVRSRFKPLKNLNRTQSPVLLSSGSGSRKSVNRTLSPVPGSGKSTPEPDLTGPRHPYRAGLGSGFQGWAARASGL